MEQSSTAKHRFLLNRYFGDDVNPLLKRWCDDALIEDSQIWPLVLFGPSGVAKTSLAETLMCRFADRQSSVLKTNGADFRRLFFDAIGTKSIDEFRQRFLGQDVIFVDDLATIGNDTNVQHEFIRLLDLFSSLKRAVLVTLDQSPLVESELCHRLRSRLSRGLLLNVRPPGPVARRAIVENLAGKLELSLEDGMLDWLVDRLPAVPMLMQRHLARLAFESTDEPWNISRADQVLQSPEPVDDRVRLRKLVQVVAKYHRLSVNDLRGSSRRQALARARSLAMYLANKQLGISYTAIGRYFSGRDQSTVRHACKSIDQALSVDTTLVRVKTQLADLLNRRLSKL